MPVTFFTTRCSSKIAICLNSSFRFSSILKEDADKEKLSKMHFSSAPTNLLSVISSHPSAFSELTKRCTCPG